MRWTALWLLLALSSLAGCNCGTAGVDALPFACTQDAQCQQPDWLCRRGECVRADAGCAAALEICDDGLENDCDALIDCADDECAAVSCGPAGRTCQGTTCTCPDGDSDGGYLESNCQDGLDDDCDSLTDCNDPDCADQVCDASGLVCVGAECQCPPPGEDGGVSGETVCNDGIDNDCDQQADCADPSCDGLACSTDGICTDGACLCTGGGTPETPEATCDDAADNDCDGLADCKDVTDCSGRACAPNGLICDGATNCTCSGNGGAAQPGGETQCTDGHDNDCDGLTDCAEDLDCSGTREPTGEVTCNDGRDNDCDGLIDCQELACDGAACGANGQSCLALVCECTGNGGVAESAGEATCGDGFDNDCDGQVDCADPDCSHRSCGPSSVCCFTGTTGCRDLSTLATDCGGCGTACDTTGPDELCQPTATSAAVSGRCTCDNPGECILGQSCTGGTCRCETEANCQADQICDNGTCRYP